VRRTITEGRPTAVQKLGSSIEVERREMAPPEEEQNVPTDRTASNVTAPTRVMKVGEQGYAYRRFGSGAGLPLLCLQHFTGTMDNWDPAVTDPLAAGREVILFDNAGVGRSSGSVPTIAGMTAHALAWARDLRRARLLAGWHGGATDGAEPSVNPSPDDPGGDSSER
jgi:hypothetical protein